MVSRDTEGGVVKTKTAFYDPEPLTRPEGQTTTRGSNVTDVSIDPVVHDQRVKPRPEGQTELVPTRTAQTATDNDQRVTTRGS